MYQHPYPPGSSRFKGDSRGRPLPPLPTQPFLKAIATYRSDQSLDLVPQDPATNIVKIVVAEPVDVGYGNFSQNIKAVLVNGLSDLVNKLVYVKFYDPMYINPDDVKTIYSDTDTRDSVAEGLELSPQTTATSTETIVDTVDLPPAEGSNAGWEVEEVQTKVYKEEVPDDIHVFWSRKNILKSLGDDHNPKNKDWDDTKFAVETRKSFSERLFKTESRAYAALNSMQGRYMAKCYGAFKVKFSDRELEDDKVVNALLFEWLPGLDLSKADPSEFNFRKRKEIRNTVLDIIKLVYQKGVCFTTNIDLGNFILVSNGHTPKIHGFEFTSSLQELDDAEGQDTPDEMVIRLQKSNIRNLEYLLNHIGFT